MSSENTVVELKQIAKNLGLKGYSKLKKSELIALINSEEEVNELEEKVEALDIQPKKSCGYEIENIKSDGVYGFTYNVFLDGKLYDHGLYLQYGDLQKNPVKPLKTLCKYLCISGYSYLNKSQLIDSIELSPIYDIIKAETRGR